MKIDFVFVTLLLVVFNYKQKDSTFIPLLNFLHSKILFNFVLIL